MLSDSSLGIDALFEPWLEMLNYYLQDYFFPPSFQKLSLGELKQSLFNQKAMISQSGQRLELDYKISRKHPLLKEIVFACNKINEFALKDQVGKKLFFRASFV
jgi:hypothetical protein